MDTTSGSVPLGALAPGAIGTLQTFVAEKTPDGREMIDRLREIGFSEGLEVEFLHQSLFGRDPIAVRVGGMIVALRRAEADLIKVQLQ